jgi:hypothetical protein
MDLLDNARLVVLLARKDTSQYVDTSQNNSDDVD